MLFVLVIEVAIGDYGMEVLDKLAKSALNNSNSEDHQHDNVYYAVSGKQELKMKNGGLSILYNFTMLL